MENGRRQRENEETAASISYTHPNSYPGDIIKSTERENINNVQPLCARGRACVCTYTYD